MVVILLHIFETIIGTSKNEDTCPILNLCLENMSSRYATANSRLVSGPHGCAEGRSQVSYRFLALGCFPANLVSDVVCVLFVLRVGSLKG